jgi:hypothetical protein
MLEIHDIKPIVEIPDYSIYFYYGLIIFGICFVLFTSYWVYKMIKSRTKSNDKEYFQILKNIDFSDVKNAAYTMTKYGRLLVKDDRQKLLLDELYASLQEYKYKKVVAPTLSNEVKLKYDTFMESLDVR